MCAFGDGPEQGSSPHTRGAPVGDTPGRRHPPGSSPHTRGALAQARFELPDIGIIPAYAGSTGRGRRGRGATRDHPRIRGEHDEEPDPQPGLRGSSPHTRGAQLAAHRRHGRGRIIPAYAGSTELVVVGHDETQDHPRIRGEHQSAMMTYLTLSGSSPHTRGAQATTPHAVRKDRIIPAYAGSTMAVSCR